MIKKQTILHTALFVTLFFCNLHAMEQPAPTAAAPAENSDESTDLSPEELATSGALVQALKSKDITGISNSNLYLLARDRKTIAYFQVNKDQFAALSSPAHASKAAALAYLNGRLSYLNTKPNKHVTPEQVAHQRIMQLTLHAHKRALLFQDDVALKAAAVSDCPGFLASRANELWQKKHGQWWKKLFSNKHKL